jgi:SDR family mycofactocin-dependent oxidoreductase
VSKVGRFDGKVAFVTGAARGQGRSHAVNLAREGADVAILDICQQIGSVEYALSDETDLAETERLVNDADRRALPVKADVRDNDAVEAAIERTVAEFGRLDLVVANAGILPTTGDPAHSLEAWRDCLDVMLSGVYYTLRAATAVMIRDAVPGAIVVTASTSSIRASAYDLDTLNPGQIGYSAAKHGVLGVVRNFAMALGTRGIRVNAVAPMGVRTPMVVNEHFAQRHSSPPAGWMANVMDVDLIEPQDVSDAVLWLLSDEARYVTGTVVPVDCGLLLA